MSTSLLPDELQSLRLVDAATAAQLLSVDEKTLANWRSAGRGPRFARLGRMIRYPLVEIQRYRDEALGLTGSRMPEASAP